MKKIFAVTLCIATFGSLSAQTYSYAPSKKFPFGQLNPNAPTELGEYADLIGKCQCKSVARIDQNTWADSVDMTWTYEYILNGMAVQDETLKADGTHSGSIRQYDKDSSTWYVHYYTTRAPSNPLPAWKGGKTEDGKIVLFKDQSAPNGTEGFFRITFSDISSTGFNWEGAWMDKAETIVYPTWRIFCSKVK